MEQPYKGPKLGTTFSASRDQKKTSMVHDEVFSQLSETYKKIRSCSVLWAMAKDLDIIVNTIQSLVDVE